MGLRPRGYDLDEVGGPVIAVIALGVGRRGLKERVEPGPFTDAEDHFDPGKSPAVDRVNDPAGDHRQPLEPEFKGGDFRTRTDLDAVKPALLERGLGTDVGLDIVPPGRQAVATERAVLPGRDRPEDELLVVLVAPQETAVRARHDHVRPGQSRALVRHEAASDRTESIIERDLHGSFRVPRDAQAGRTGPSR